MAVIDFPNLGLEVVGLGFFWGSAFGALVVGAGMAVFKFPWNGSSPFLFGVI